MLLRDNGMLLENKCHLLTKRRFVALNPPFRDPRNAVSLLSVRRREKGKKSGNCFGVR